MSPDKRPKPSAAKLTFWAFAFIIGIFLLGGLTGDSKPRLFAFITFTGILIFGALISRYVYLLFKK
jgi:hypothetical protein